MEGELLLSLVVLVLLVAALAGPPLVAITAAIFWTGRRGSRSRGRRRMP